MTHHWRRLKSSSFSPDNHVCCSAAFKIIYVQYSSTCSLGGPEDIHEFYPDILGFLISLAIKNLELKEVT